MWIVNHFINRVVKCNRGGGGDSEAPAPKKISPLEESRAQVQALQEGIPKTAQLQFDVLQKHLQPTTQLQEDVRSQVFGQESAVRDQLLQNVLQSLISPTGITPEQQQAQQAIRGRAQNDLVEALRTRANLGGGLFGGRAAGTEERAVSEMQQGFATEDINRQEQARLNALNAALSSLGTLFPGAQIAQPQFINPVVSPDQQFSGATSQANLEAQLESQRRAQDMQLQSALWTSLGSAVGDAAGAAAGAAWGEGGVWA